MSNCTDASRGSILRIFRERGIPFRFDRPIASFIESAIAFFFQRGRIKQRTELRSAKLTSSNEPRTVSCTDCGEKEAMTAPFFAFASRTSESISTGMITVRTSLIPARIPK